MKIRHTIYTMLLCLCAMAGNDCAAQEKYWIEDLLNENISFELDNIAPEDAHPDLIYLTVEENLAIPELTKKQQAKAREKQATEVARLKKVEGLEVETMRNGEVIHVTILSSLLFVPNETTLKYSCDTYLRALLPFLRIEDYYHVLVVVHSDNTGDEEYSFALTSDRSIAIIDWLEDNGGNVKYVIPYAAGNVEPRSNNNTIEGRNLNRRVEVFIIPAEAMFE